MKKITGFFLVLGFVLAFPVLKLHAQKSFEGTITMSMTMPIMGDEDPHPMLVNIKDQKSETEMDMGAKGSVKIYMDGVTKKGYIVTGPKTGYVYSTSDPSAKGIMKNDTSDFKPSGQKATIAGHPAEEYVLDGVMFNGHKVDMSFWVASDFPKDIVQALYHSLSNNPSMDPKEGNAFKSIAGRGLMPVRIVTKVGGEVAVTNEFVKYEQKSLSDALFVPPTDVTFTPMPKAAGGTN